MVNIDKQVKAIEVIEKFIPKIDILFVELKYRRYLYLIRLNEKMYEIYSTQFDNLVKGDLRNAKAYVLNNDIVKIYKVNPTTSQNERLY